MDLVDSPANSLEGYVCKTGKVQPSLVYLYIHSVKLISLSNGSGSHLKTHNCLPNTRDRKLISSKISGVSLFPFLRSNKLPQSLVEITWDTASRAFVSRVALLIEI